MSREDVATALDKAAEALAEAAHALRASHAPEAGPAPAAQAAAGSPSAAPVNPAPRRDESAFTECPAHRKPWTEGRYGKMCTSHEPDDAPHDADWYNDKGYCRVTPRSAGAWLKQHPRAA